MPQLNNHDGHHPIEIIVFYMFNEFGGISQVPMSKTKNERRMKKGMKKEKRWKRSVSVEVEED